MKLQSRSSFRRKTKKIRSLWGNQQPWLLSPQERSLQAISKENIYIDSPVALNTKKKQKPTCKDYILPLFPKSFGKFQLLLRYSLSSLLKQSQPKTTLQNLHPPKPTLRKPPKTRKGPQKAQKRRHLYKAALGQHVQGDRPIPQGSSLSCSGLPPGHTTDMDTVCL